MAAADATSAAHGGPHPGTVGPVGAVAAAWSVSVAFDLFLHAGLLARLYARPSAFLLPAGGAFRRIPLGYASFLALTAALLWLFRRIDVSDWLSGLRVGFLAGLILWGAWLLGLYSISVAEPDLLIGWWVGQAAELGLAGAVLGAARSGLGRRTLWLKVAAAAALLVVATAALQSLGWAPPMELAAPR